MKRSHFSEEHIIGSLKEHQSGLCAKDLCRKHGVHWLEGYCEAMTEKGRCDVLEMAVQIWRVGSLGCKEVEGA